MLTLPSPLLRCTRCSQRFAPFVKSHTNSTRPLLPSTRTASAISQLRPQASQREHEESLRTSTLLTALTPAAWLVASAASADETVSSGSGDIVVNVMFSLVVALLSVVTGGVAYISIKNWLDERQEKKDKEDAGRPSAFQPRQPEPVGAKREKPKKEKRGFGN